VQARRADGTTVTAASARLHAPIWNWRAPSLVAEGVAGTLPAATPLGWTAERLRADATPLPGGASRVDAELNRLALALPGGPLSVERVRSAYAPDGQAVGVELRLELVQLPPAMATPLGTTIAEIDAVVRSEPPRPEGFDAAALEHWRAATGALQVERFGLVWGPLQLNAEGTLALDAALQPLFAGTARATGVPETIDVLAAAGAMKPNSAALAKMGIGLIAKPNAAGVPELQTPISVQDRKLHLGAIKLLDLPELKLR
jgi:hypothetical protein